MPCDTGNILENNRADANVTHTPHLPCRWQKACLLSSRCTTRRPCHFPPTDVHSVARQPGPLARQRPCGWFASIKRGKRVGLSFFREKNLEGGKEGEPSRRNAKGWEDVESQKLNASRQNPSANRLLPNYCLPAQHQRLLRGHKLSLWLRRDGED